MSHTFNHQELASKEKCMSGLRSSIYRVSGGLTVGLLAVALLLMPTEAHAVPASKVFLNGVPTPVSSTMATAFVSCPTHLRVHGHGFKGSTRSRAMDDATSGVIGRAVN